MAGNFAMLRMISAENNNKFYKMSWDGISSEMVCEYGRIDLTSTTISKPYRDWDKVIKEKEKKGYKNVTHLIAETVVVSTDNKSSDLVDIKDVSVSRFMKLMQDYTKNLVKKTYSVQAKNVTKAQIDEAQALINDLSSIDRTNESLVNAKLLALYTVIPRYMSKVPDYLMPNIDLNRTFQQEQDNLDAMAAQVSIGTAEEVTDEVVAEQKTILDVLGIKMEVLETYNSDIQYLIDQIKSNRNYRIDKVYKVDKAFENDKFEKWLDKQKNKTTRYLIHGTRCTSVIPILEQGLKIRPAGNFQFSGKVYGDGNYFSETVVKSLGYTGYDPDKVLLVYEVHTGNPFVYNGWYKGNSFTLNYNNLESRGFDSTFVSAGNGLLNSEIIAYKEEQCRPKYIIHIK